MHRSPIELGNLAEGSYPFKLTVSPDESMPAATGAREARPSGRRRP
jgi:hypothetical protein